MRADFGAAVACPRGGAGVRAVFFGVLGARRRGLRNLTRRALVLHAVEAPAGFTEVRGGLVRPTCVAHLTFGLPPRNFRLRGCGALCGVRRSGPPLFVLFTLVQHPAHLHLYLRQKFLVPFCSFRGVVGV